MCSLCPQTVRSATSAWDGNDLSVFSPAMSYIFNGAQFLRRHQLALRDTQLPGGEFAAIAPVGGGFGGPLWQSAGIVVPWQSYLQYDDIDALREHYPAMKHYMEMAGTKYIDPAKHYFKGTTTWSDWATGSVSRSSRTTIRSSSIPIMSTNWDL